MAVTKKAKSIAEKLVPISPEFYDSQKDEDLIADKKVLFPFNAFLLFSQWVAFIILMVWYASSANYSGLHTADRLGLRARDVQLHPHDGR